MGLPGSGRLLEVKLVGCDVLALTGWLWLQERKCVVLKACVCSLTVAVFVV